MNPSLPFVRPAIPPLERVMERLRPSYECGILTNGPLVRELEHRIAARLGVAHAVAVSSCTAGLILALRAAVPAGRVLLPSFTFSASAHAVAWNGLEPVFCECDPDSFQIDVADAARRVESCAAMLATHVFGAPCPVDAVTAVAAEARIPVVFDAAHALGAVHAGRPIGGNGAAEVFSLSPTKPLVAGEGGLVTTNRDDVARVVRLGRDYGNPGDYDTEFVGLNARMSELHAAVALESLEDFDDNLARRRHLAATYERALAGCPYVRTQRVGRGDESTYKDFTIAVDTDVMGCTRDALAARLKDAGIDSRPYFDPPVHLQRSHRRHGVSLPVTEAVASSVLSLPIYPSMSDHDVERVAGAVRSVLVAPV